ncbi:MAG: hypothetical protein ABL864_02480 [Terricaulis sp.]|jgi:hypothetical protein
MDPQTPMAEILYLGGDELDVVHREFRPAATALDRARDGGNQADLGERLGARAFQIMPPGTSQIADATALEAFSG